VKSKEDNLRVYLVYSFFSLLFLVIFLRIAYFQLVQKDIFKTLAQNQHIKVVPIKGDRGRIFDRKKRPLASNVSVFSVYIDPKMIKEKQPCAEILAKLLDLDKDAILKKMETNKRFVWIKRKISLPTKEKISAAKFKGVGFVKDKRRFYPEGDLLSQTLGGVNIDNVGIDGIEIERNKSLGAKDGFVSILRDSTAKKLYLTPQILESQKGFDLVLTIDAQIQYWTESYLSEAVAYYSAKKASAIVMDVSNGEIIALANVPGFDLNNISKAKRANMRNGAVSDIFEPGSVFKIVTLVGALDKNLFTLKDEFFCENGKMTIPGSILHDWKPYGTLSFEEVFKKSSNIGVAKIANALGPMNLYDYIKRMGFDSKTGIDLPGEARGSLKHFSSWSRTSPYIIPMGQEVGVTMVQLVRAIAAIANGGDLVRPHLVKKTLGDYGFSKDTKIEKSKVLPESTANSAKRVLIKVVNDGTGRRARVDGARVGGKTGTAQKYDSSIGGYSPTAYRATFLGFVEKGDDCFAICVSVDEPMKSHFGGVVAAPIFQKIAQNLINYIGLEKGQRIARLQ